MKKDDFTRQLAAAGLTKRQMSNEIGISMQAINKWLRTDAIPGWVEGWIEGKIAKRHLLELKAVLAAINQFGFFDR